MADERRGKEPEEGRPQGEPKASPENRQGGRRGKDRGRPQDGRDGRGRQASPQRQPASKESPRDGRQERGQPGRGSQGQQRSRGLTTGQMPASNGQQQRQRPAEPPSLGQSPQAPDNRSSQDRGSNRQSQESPAGNQGKGGQRKRLGKGPRSGQNSAQRVMQTGGERRESFIGQVRADAPICPICEKPVHDLSSALGSDRETGLPAHFDCVYERISAAENLGPGEKVVYLGSGSFAIVEFKDGKEAAFVVKRRIQWEKEGEKKEWRKSLHSRFLGM
ncbi:MAG: hypothetical protein WCQ50_17160 [Spirochaetota bacterium]